MRRKGSERIRPKSDQPKCWHGTVKKCILQLTSNSSSEIIKWSEEPPTYSGGQFLLNLRNVGKFPFFFNLFFWLLHHIPLKETFVRESILSLE